MKKMMGLMLCVLFMAAGCEENKRQDVQAAPAKPAVAAVKAEPAPVQKKIEIVNVDWTKALEMSKNGAILVDVRTPGEVAEGMAPGALNIPLQEIQQRLGEFPKDKPLLIYCRSGKRSMAASEFLVQNGYEQVFNVVGGFLAFPKN